MITGIGVDICNIARMEKAIKSEHFRKEIFTRDEIAYCESKGNRRAESYAASFAAREAFCKASGIDLEHIMLGKNFALLRDSTGKPEISLTGDLAMSDSNVLVSISHEKEYACAMVVIEKF